MNKYFNYTVLAISILFSSQSMAVSVSDAVSASENNDTVEAIKLWSQLASAGNTIAQYNLAKYYSAGSGVPKNKQTANKWLKDATRSGFIQAYLNLNKSAIAPAKGVTLKFDIETPITWLVKQDPKKYTIQLASSRNEKSIQRAFDNNHLKGKGGYYHYIRQGVERYALIYGSFKTVAAANVAMKDLPENLRKKTPWVRKIKSLQNISK